MRLTLTHTDTHIHRERERERERERGRRGSMFFQSLKQWVINNQHIMRKGERVISESLRKKKKTVERSGVVGVVG